MAAPISQPTVLDFFRAKKDEPLIQYLTWYLILVLEWKFEDIISVEISPFIHAPWDCLRGAYTFMFHNGKRIRLEIIQTDDLKFYVSSSWSVA